MRLFRDIREEPLQDGVQPQLNRLATGPAGEGEPVHLTDEASGPLIALHPPGPPRGLQRPGTPGAFDHVKHTLS